MRYLFVMIISKPIQGSKVDTVHWTFDICCLLDRSRRLPSTHGTWSENDAKQPLVFPISCLPPNHIRFGKGLSFICIYLDKFEIQLKIIGPVVLKQISSRNLMDSEACTRRNGLIFKILQIQPHYGNVSAMKSFGLEMTPWRIFEN